MSNKVDHIIFLHLPKAGGTTLRHIFYRQYSHLKEGEIYTINRTKETPEFYGLSDADRRKIKVLVGHFPFGLHKHLHGDFKYVTFLRHPVERTISAYSFNKEKKDGDVYVIINEKEYSLEAYLDDRVEPWMFNAMTKHLAGVDLDEFKAPATDDLYQKALRNLDKHFSFVGFTEHFDESIMELKRLLNWSMPLYKKKNITKQKARGIEPHVVEKIKTTNHYDLQLYETLLARFEQRRKHALEQMVFQAANKIYSLL